MITQQTEVDSVHRKKWVWSIKCVLPPPLPPGKKLNLTSSVCECSIYGSMVNMRGGVHVDQSDCAMKASMILVGGVRKTANCMRKMYDCA